MTHEKLASNTSIIMTNSVEMGLVSVAANDLGKKAWIHQATRATTDNLRVTVNMTLIGEVCGNK
jgi:hypothetical protein